MTLTGNDVEGAEKRGIVIGQYASPTLTGHRVCDSGENLVVDEDAEPVMQDNEICPDTLAEASE